MFLNKKLAKQSNRNVRNDTHKNIKAFHIYGFNYHHHHQCRINANRGPWQLFARAPLYTYARQRPITLEPLNRYDMLAIISSRYQYGPFLFFCCRSYIKLLDYWRAEKMFSTSGGPLWPEARGICHICHMVNPALIIIIYLHSMQKWTVKYAMCRTERLTVSALTTARRYRIVTIKTQL